MSSSNDNVLEQKSSIIDDISTIDDNLNFISNDANKQLLIDSGNNDDFELMRSSLSFATIEKDQQEFSENEQNQLLIPSRLTCLDDDEFSTMIVPPSNLSSSNSSILSIHMPLTEHHQRSQSCPTTDDYSSMIDQKSNNGQINEGR
ncbi:unnamed protein product [Didymodactylos carnosus]|uniref:Uncharacterized protein n=1 Tax=Didymodactylos carnosus TaxID=1234261 RepID=A0A8S2GAD5_9BILA|nr:unnamed protein product [Didymodactylos carnosus]CAF4519362.1 unnamed protein product [Didymodactylos carnosus]